MYVDGGYNSGDFTLNLAEEKVDLLRVSAGFNKDFYLTHSIHFGPFIGYGIESSTWKTSKYKIETQFVEVGARLGINLTYNIQLIGSANYYLMMSPAVKDADGKAVVSNLNFSDYFPDRGGLGYSYGIRFMF
jgi:hypothetical protein